MYALSVLFVVAVWLVARRTVSDDRIFLVIFVACCAAIAFVPLIIDAIR